MRCKGEFNFKSLKKIDGGKFVNDKGQEIEYKSKYLLKVDEIVDGDIYERVFKIPIDSILISQLMHKDIYSKIVLEFDIKLYANSALLIPVGLINMNNK